MQVGARPRSYASAPSRRRRVPSGGHRGQLMEFRRGGGTSPGTMARDRLTSRRAYCIRNRSVELRCDEGSVRRRLAEARGDLPARRCSGRWPRPGSRACTSTGPATPTARHRRGRADRASGARAAREPGWTARFLDLSTYRSRPSAATRARPVGRRGGVGPAPMVVTWRGGFYGRERGRRRRDLALVGRDGGGPVANPSGRPAPGRGLDGLATMGAAPGSRLGRWPGVAAEWPADSSQRLELTSRRTGQPCGSDRMRRRHQRERPAGPGVRIERFRVEDRSGPGASRSRRGGATLRGSTPACASGRGSSFVIDGLTIGRTRPGIRRRRQGCPKGDRPPP